LPTEERTQEVFEKFEDVPWSTKLCEINYKLEVIENGFDHNPNFPLLGMYSFFLLRGVTVVRYMMLQEYNFRHGFLNVLQKFVVRRKGGNLANEFRFPDDYAALKVNLAFE
jgi:hypothetical protein